MSGTATVLSEGPFKGRRLPAEGDVLLLPTSVYTESPGPLSPDDTDPHRRLWVTLFGKKFYVWVPVDVPDDLLPEYIASQLLNPLGLGLWREGEDIDARAEKVELVHPYPPARTDVRAYRPAKVPEAPGRTPGHHGPRPRPTAG